MTVEIVCHKHRKVWNIPKSQSYPLCLRNEMASSLVRLVYIGPSQCRKPFRNETSCTWKYIGAPQFSHKHFLRASELQNVYAANTDIIYRGGERWKRYRYMGDNYNIGTELLEMVRIIPLQYRRSEVPRLK